jgi:hypothetical protein
VMIYSESTHAFQFELKTLSFGHKQFA